MRFESIYGRLPIIATLLAIIACGGEEETTAPTNAGIPDAGMVQRETQEERVEGKPCLEPSEETCPICLILHLGDEKAGVCTEPCDPGNPNCPDGWECIFSKPVGSENPGQYLCARKRPRECQRLIDCACNSPVEDLRYQCNAYSTVYSPASCSVRPELCNDCDRDLRHYVSLGLCTETGQPLPPADAGFGGDDGKTEDWDGGLPQINDD